MNLLILYLVININLYAGENPLHLDNYKIPFNTWNEETLDISGLVPPLSNSKIAREILNGTCAGIAGGFLGILALGQLMDRDDEQQSTDATGGLVLMVVGFMAGYPVGSAIGVYWEGNRGDETGSFLATLLGSCIGALAFVLPAPIGATIGFNMTRKYKPQNTSPMHMDNRPEIEHLPEVKGTKHASKVELSDSLAARKFSKQPLPPYPDWAYEQNISAAITFKAKVNAYGKIDGRTKILVSTNYPAWDNGVVEWCKDHWRWEKSTSETEGTITIEFSREE